VAISKMHPDLIVVFRSPLAVNHVPTSCRFFIRGTYVYLVSKLPGVFRKYASPMCANVICVGPLVFVCTRTF
jgi:hypothetical protein